MRFRMDPRAKLYLLLLANLMLFFHVSLAAEAIMAAGFARSGGRPGPRCAAHGRG